jgi:predicted Rossmann-fold nucleotide-binding protein
MDELFEALTLVQTGRIEPLPIVLMGEDYWKPVAALLDQMAATALIAPSDVRLAMITNDVDDAVRFIRERTRDVTPAPREGTPRVARWTAGFGAGFAIRTRGPAGRAWR